MEKHDYLHNFTRHSDLRPAPCTLHNALSNYWLKSMESVNTVNGSQEIDNFLSLALFEQLLCWRRYQNLVTADTRD